MLAQNNHIPLSFRWQRRNTPEVRKADSFSKQQDLGDWRLSREYFSTQVTKHARRWSQRGYFPPDIDMMASRWAHQVPTYVSAFWDERCIAQDAFVQHWGQWPTSMARETTKRQPCLFLFPPTVLLPLVLMKIDREQPTAWLVCSRYLRDIDSEFIARWPIKARFPLQCRDVAQVVRPTPVNPAFSFSEVWHTPLQAIFATWEAV